MTKSGMSALLRDGFDIVVSKDGLVTIYDINDVRGPVGNTSFTVDLSVTRNQTLEALSDDVKTNPAIATFQTVQSEGNEHPSLVDLFV